MNCEADGNVIRALGRALAGTNSTLVVATAFIGPNSQDETPDDYVAVADGYHPRGETDLAADEVAKSGVRVVTARLPYSAHGEPDLLQDILDSDVYISKKLLWSKSSRSIYQTSL
ncbi:unnamed protein product [Aphanomyces euteiches]